MEARGKTSGMESIFEFGFREFARLRAQGGVAADMLLEGSRRAMRVAQLKEIERLEQSLATLATVGSTSPYVGLFGTVWGIMNAFSSLGNVQQATLAMVAPGISEALVTTAMGLFAAIPAVVAYNRYADLVSRLETALRRVHGGAVDHPPALCRTRTDRRTCHAFGRAGRLIWPQLIRANAASWARSMWCPTST